MGRAMNLGTFAGRLVLLACLLGACDDDEQPARVTAAPNLEVAKDGPVVTARDAGAFEVSGEEEDAAPETEAPADGAIVSETAAEATTMTGTGDSATVCQRSCAASAASFCPSFPSDCVASCQTLIAAVCTTEMTAFLECLATLTPAQLECDEAGAPRPRPTHCQPELAAASDCLSRS